VSGTFSKQPKGHCWLFVRDGFEYWPQHEVQFDKVNKTWQGHIYVGSSQADTPVTIMLVRLSDDYDLLAKYYGRVYHVTRKYVSIDMSSVPSSFDVLTEITVT
jgi:hypothetical protein